MIILTRNIETNLSLEVDIDIIHENSEVIKQLQLADIFCYWFMKNIIKKNWVDWSF